MATAVIRTGGQQYRVSEGETIKVEKLAGEPGSKVEFSEVLAIAGGDSPKLGKPLVSGAKVQGEIVTQGRGEKLVIFKFKRRKRHRRKNGHRQSFTAVRITSIEG
jgi:large subunit ribosomal protein L21